MIMKKFGPITLFGSGETLPASGAAYEYNAIKLDQPPQISILETPAGFQPNTEIVARKVAEFIESRLQNYHPATKIIPARKSEGEFSTNSEKILEPLLSSNWIFIGPGSPTYAAKHMKNSLLYKYLYAAHAAGSALTFSSAAVLAMSHLTLPVYEIYKVGDELHWRPGLDFFLAFGLESVFIPHWNNNSGGEELDTRRCYMGVERFLQLKKLLPQDMPIIGIDEQTALTFNFENKIRWKVTGIGNVTIEKDARISTLAQGEYDPGDYGFSMAYPKSFSPDITDLITRFENTKAQENVIEPPEAVIMLAEKRATARDVKDWQTADQLRSQIEKLGWGVLDQENGYELTPQND